MMRRLTEFLIVFATISVGLLIAFFAGYYTHAWSLSTPLLRLPLPGLQQTDKNYALLVEARTLLEQHYNGTLPDDVTLEYGAIRGLLSAVGDPYTIFIEPPVAQIETQTLQGEYGGIGVNIAKSDIGEIVLSPFRESPAAQAGLKEGDVLIGVDDTPITLTTSLDEVTALVRGLVGTQVKISVRHTDGTSLTATITRQTIQIPSVTWKMVDGQSDIGLISLSRFSEKTPAEVREATVELRAQGATRFVLDLRNNGGGLLDSAVEVASIFLDGGVVMYETEKDGPEKTYTAPASSDPLTTIPVAVLVNGGTASAAEIVAGALLDRNRAPLIGQKTFGKGSVQFIFPLSDGSSLHVTARLWFTPNRRQLHQNGLPPTLDVQPSGDGTDAELAQAINYLHQVISSK